MDHGYRFFVVVWWCIPHMMMMVIPVKVAEDTLSQSLSSSYGQMDWCWENASWQIL